MSRKVAFFRLLELSLNHCLISSNEIIEKGDPLKGNLTRLISILYMAKKHQFPEHKEWAKSQLQQCFASSHVEELKYMNATSSANDTPWLLLFGYSSYHPLGRFQALEKSVMNRLCKGLVDHFLGPVIGNASR